MKFSKQLDKLVVTSFIGPYVISFLVAEFVLVLQFLWKYIDEFIGRGVSLFTITKMIFYYGVTIIPLSVPISILISSVMVYGAMAERYELTAFKSAGVSLNRIIRPGLIIAILTAMLSLFASNYLKPKANFKFFQTFDNVRRAKPTLTIEEGIFNYDFKGFAIRVGEKAPDGRKIKDILVYDQTVRGKLSMTAAESGEMFISDDGRFFNMLLYNGTQYSEIDNGRSPNKKQEQFMRVKFETWKKQFDMSQFDFSFSNSNLSRRKHDLYNAYQMYSAIDSINISLAETIENHDLGLNRLYPDGGTEIDDDLDDEETETDEIQEDIEVQDEIEPGSRNLDVIKKKSPNRKVLEQLQELKNRNRSDNGDSKSDLYYLKRIQLRKDSISLDTVTSFAQTFKNESLKSLLFRTKSDLQAEREKFRTTISAIDSAIYGRNRFELRLHQQFCWAIICIVFMLIGAPLGSIVRKGGFGYPLLIAIAFFIVFIFTSILGEKMMISGNMNPVLAAWLPFVVLLPFSFYFMKKAINDSRFELNFKKWFS